MFHFNMDTTPLGQKKTYTLIKDLFFGDIGAFRYTPYQLQLATSLAFCFYYYSFFESCINHASKNIKQVKCMYRAFKIHIEQKFRATFMLVKKY